MWTFHESLQANTQSVPPWSRPGLYWETSTPGGSHEQAVLEPLGAWKPSSEIPGACTVSWMYETRTNKQTKYNPPARLATRTRDDDDVPLFRCLLAREHGTQTDTAAVAHVHARSIHANLCTCTSRLGAHTHGRTLAAINRLYTDRPVTHDLSFVYECRSPVTTGPEPITNTRLTHTCMYMLSHTSCSLAHERKTYHRSLKYRWKFIVRPPCHLLFSPRLCSHFGQFHVHGRVFTASSLTPRTPTKGGQKREVECEEKWLDGCERDEYIKGT